MANPNNVQMKIINEKKEQELIYPKTLASLVDGLNIFSTIKVGGSGLIANSYKDVVEILPGENIQISVNTSNKTISFSSSFKDIYKKNEIDNLLENIQLTSNLFDNFILDSTIDLGHVINPT